MSVRHSDKYTLAVIVHTISTVKKIAKDGQSDMSMPFGVKQENKTLAIYGIANIFPHKKNNV